MKHWYAEFSKYGVGTLSSGDCLFRFTSRTERDAVIEKGNAACESPKWSAAKVRDVSHRYRIAEFDDPDVADREIGCIFIRSGYTL